MRAIVSSEVLMLASQHHVVKVLMCCSQARFVGRPSATVTVVVTVVASLASFRPALASMIKLEKPSITTASAREFTADSTTVVVTTARRLLPTTDCIVASLESWMD